MATAKTGVGAVFDAMRTASAATALSMLCVFIVASASAQPYPSRPIRFMVTYPAGTSLDVYARKLSPKLSEALGQTIVIDNRGGAGGIIGTEIVAKAPADGYTLLMGTSATMAVNVNIYKKLPYDPIKDFAPVARLVAHPLVMVVSTALPVKTIPELVAYARTRPGKLNYGSTGSGTAGHVAGAYFNSVAGLTLSHVPYRSAVDEVADVARGELLLMFYPYEPMQGMIQAGRVKVLATTGGKRSAFLPDMPTMVEAGYSNFNLGSWVAMYAPARTPKAVIDRIYGALQKFMQDPELVARWGKEGHDVTFEGPRELDKFTRDEIQRYKELAALAGIVAN